MYEEVVLALTRAFEVMPEGVDLSKGGLETPVQDLV